MRKWQFLISLLFITILGINSVDAQRRKKDKLERFAAGLVIGYGFSQIDGDDYTGFDRNAPLFGFQVSTQLHEKWSLDINFTYIKKGSNIENDVNEFRVNPKKDRTVHLDYAEVPVLFKFRPRGNQSKFYVEGGFSYGKMIHSEITERITDFTEIIFADIEDEFKKGEICAVFGCGSAITNDFTLGIRYSYGINKFYFNEHPTERVNYNKHYPDEVLFLRNYYISFVLSYKVF